MMNREHKVSKSTYDKPIERPFEELPDWFIRTLHSRMVTKRFPKQHETGANRAENAKYVAASRRRERV